MARQRNYNRKCIIKFSYNSTEHEITIRLNLNRSVEYVRPYVTKTALSGKTYKMTTGAARKRIWTYIWDNGFSDIYNILSAVDEAANDDNLEITHSVENDDGTFTNYDVLINDFYWDDETLSNITNQKIYKNLSMVVHEI